MNTTLQPESVDIHRLNHLYLLCLRDHALRDAASACSRFGTTPSLAQAVTSMPLADLENVAKTDQLLFFSNLTPKDLGNLARAEHAIRNVYAVLAQTTAAGAQS